MHMLWTCQWIEGKAGPTPESWKREIEAGSRLELWNRGFIQLPTWNVLQGHQTIQGWGTWHSGPKDVPEQDFVTVSVQATTKDPRSRHYVVGLTHHNRQLERMGAVTMVLYGKQTLIRAWVQALKLALDHTTRRQQIYVLNIQAWEAWKDPEKRQQVFDIVHPSTEEELQRIQVLYCSQKMMADLGQAQDTWKTRWNDIKKVLSERCEAVRDKATEEFLAKQDTETKKIYHEAIERVKTIVEDKTHYGKQEPEENPKEKRAKARERKADLLKSLKEARPPQGHKWMEHKRGFKCAQCDKEVNGHTPYDQIKKAKEEECPLHGMSVPEMSSWPD